MCHLPVLLCENLRYLCQEAKIAQCCQAHNQSVIAGAESFQKGELPEVMEAAVLSHEAPE